MRAKRNLRQELVARASVAALLAVLGGCASAPSWWADLQGAGGPTRAQPGKDVMWIPTPEARVRRMLQLARCAPSDRVVDLGSGDGAIVIAAARDCGASGLGIEYDPRLVEHARGLAEAAGLGDRARFEKADLFDTDFADATIVTMYLQRHLNLRLRHRLLALRPGTRIVSHEFDLGGWRPDETSRVGTGAIHLWIVPANFGGEWELEVPTDEGRVSARIRIGQRFQDLRGVAVFEGVQTSLRDGRVEGGSARFGFTDGRGRLLRFEATLEDDRLAGVVRDGGEAVRFEGVRTGPAASMPGSAPATDLDALDQPGEAW